MLYYLTLKYNFTLCHILFHVKIFHKDTQNLFLNKNVYLIFLYFLPVGRTRRSCGSWTHGSRSATSCGTTTSGWSSRSSSSCSSPPSSPSSSTPCPATPSRGSSELSGCVCEWSWLHRQEALRSLAADCVKVVMTTLCQDTLFGA